MTEEDEDRSPPDAQRLPPPDAAGEARHHNRPHAPDKVEPGEQGGPSPPKDGGLEAAAEEMDAIAERYEDDGWETYRCHPGGVELLEGDGDDEYVGIDVIIADNELDESVEFLDGGSFERYQVFRDAIMGVLLFVVAVEDPENEAVLLFAGYLDLDDVDRLIEGEVAGGSFPLYLRNVRGEHVEFGPVDVRFFYPADVSAPTETEESGDDSTDG